MRDLRPIFKKTIFIMTSIVTLMMAIFVSTNFLLLGNEIETPDAMTASSN